MVKRQDHRFDALKLAANGGELSGRLVVSGRERLADRVAGDGVAVDWSIAGGRDRAGRLALTVTVAGQVPLQCQRCLGRFDWPVDQRTEVLLATSEAEMARLDEASEDEVVLADAPLDPATLVEDELLLTLPYAPRHPDRCPAD
jgi:uncharacterized protein